MRRGGRLGAAGYRAAGGADRGRRVRMVFVLFRQLGGCIHLGGSRILGFCAGAFLGCRRLRRRVRYRGCCVGSRGAPAAGLGPGGFPELCQHNAEHKQHHQHRYQYPHHRRKLFGFGLRPHRRRRRRRYRLGRVGLLFRRLYRGDGAAVGTAVGTAQRAAIEDLLLRGDKYGAVILILQLFQLPAHLGRVGVAVCRVRGTCLQDD